MKKSKHIGWLVLALALFLTGCGADSTKTEAEAEANEKKVPTPEEILQKSFEADENLNSFDVDMTAESTVKATGIDQTTSTTMSGSIIDDPFTFKLNMNAMGQEVEAYLKDDMMYMYEPTTAMWVKMDAESAAGESLNTDQLTNPEEQIKQVQEIADSIEVSETDSTYVLDVKVAEDKMMTLMEEQMGQSIEEVQEVDDFTFDKFSYVITIDKETNHMQNMKMDMVVNVTADGQEGTVNALVDMNVSNFNGFDSIELPAEAEAAMDISNADQMMEEEAFTY
ncbi:DUF6612 family protein [Terribacillus saccharophilus]|uniref:DUF6612 family protein n=1 Tax=Terribacillus saccharophilus TaxID=361277 RepID=UPI003982CAE6